MLFPNLSPLSSNLQPAGLWAFSLLASLVREECLLRRAARLAEPGLKTWEGFRGRLNFADLLALLFEDEAVRFRVPFDPSALPGLSPPFVFPDSIVKSWIDLLIEQPPVDDPLAFLGAIARFLGVAPLPPSYALPQLLPHHQVLELPGCGGLFALQLALAFPELSLHKNFCVLSARWQESTLAGLAALEGGAQHSEFVVPLVPNDLRSPEHPVRASRHFDFVIGLHPDHGGLFAAHEQLHLWFPSSSIVLV